MDNLEKEVINTSANTTNQSTDQNQNPNPEDNFTFDNQTIMASLAYLGPLVLIPFLVNKNDTFIKYHTKQGFIIFGISIASYLLGFLFIPLFFLAPLLTLLSLTLNICIVVLVVIGIRNALQKKEEELPFVGKYARKINI